MIVDAGAKVTCAGVNVSYIPAELIKKKKLGGHHSHEEIDWLISAFTQGEFTDYQMAAWAMAVWFNGMTADETTALTTAMLRSGSRFDFSSLNAPRVDKHSTGGVGDKTSLLIGPLLAAAHVYSPMISGRGLGHTGGTLDKLESIPGFRVNLSREEFASHVARHYFAVMGQTADICPADKKLYSLRDVTSTVDSLPLICASIMSKKLAEDLTSLVLDVKFGSGALMKNVAEARKLALSLKAIGEKSGIRVTALITNMNEPLGRFAGNAAEVFECYEILQGKTFIADGRDLYAPTRDLSIELSAHALLLSRCVDDLVNARSHVRELLDSGAALRAFENLLEYQGPSDISKLPTAPFSKTLKASRSGFISAIQTETIGLALIELGAGRKTTNDHIDPTAGVEMLVRIGDELSAGAPLCRIFANSDSTFATVERLLVRAIEIDEIPPEPISLIAEVLADSP